MSTLLLDTALWDLTVDVYGNIALASDPYAVAQDVASALRLFQAELWYDTSQGLPYFQQILGQRPSLEFLKAQFVKAAMTVPEVASAKAFITAFTNRELTGQVQVTLTGGARLALQVGVGIPWYVQNVNLNPLS